MSDPTSGTPLAPPQAVLRAAYIDFRRRSFRQTTRGIPTPAQHREWADDADALIAAHDREVRVEALREAAREARGKWGVKPYVDEWLESLADRLAAEGGAS